MKFLWSILLWRCICRVLPWGSAAAWEGAVCCSVLTAELLIPASLFQSNGGAKRQKLSHQSYISYQKQGIRRSTRHRKVRGEKALLVSANQTLKELKIQVRRSCCKKHVFWNKKPMKIIVRRAQLGGDGGKRLNPQRWRRHVCVCAARGVLV